MRFLMWSIVAITVFSLIYWFVSVWTTLVGVYVLYWQLLVLASGVGV